MTKAGVACRFWPHPRYATTCAVDEWDGASPRGVKIHEWLEDWLTGLSDDGAMLSAFPTREHEGFAVPPDGMREDLEEELALYE